VGGNKLKNQIKVTEQIRTVLKEGKIELYIKEVLIGRVSITLEKQGKLIDSRLYRSRRKNI
jgi:hypothetical protein